MRDIYEIAGDPASTKYRELSAVSGSLAAAWPTLLLRQPRLREDPLQNGCYQGPAIVMWRAPAKSLFVSGRKAVGWNIPSARSWIAL